MPGFGSVINSLSGGFGDAINSAVKSLPRSIETAVPGGAGKFLADKFESSVQKDASQIEQASMTGNTVSPEYRVRLSALYPKDVFKGDLMSPLSPFNGVMFPYTPAITFTQAVNYMDLQLVHSNTDYAAYTRTPSVNITINGKFTVQNQTEGLYALACLHFLRTVSKSYFGRADAAKSDRAGLPPPILLLDGYGDYIFNKLRVVLKSHSWTFDDSADGVIVKAAKGFARIPALFTINCEVMVVQTPTRMREQFSFEKFASGELMEAGGWT